MSGRLGLGRLYGRRLVALLRSVLRSGIVGAGGHPAASSDAAEHSFASPTSPGKTVDTPRQRPDGARDLPATSRARGGRAGRRPAGRRVPRPARRSCARPSPRRALRPGPRRSRGGNVVHVARSRSMPSLTPARCAT